MSMHDSIYTENGSYRDRESFVFYSQDRICRALADRSWNAVERAWREGVLPALIRDGLIVRSEKVSESSDEYIRLSDRYPGWKHFLVHENIPFVSYPYEWCFSMLADAAVLHLQIQQVLLKHELSLKDASAFNVQFNGARPIFIDLGSIEEPTRRDVWIAYSQFCRMFLFPLLLHLYAGMSFKQVFLADIEGPSVDQVVQHLGRWRVLQPSMFLDVFLQHVLSPHGKKKARSLRTELQSTGASAEAQLINLHRLSRKIEGLRQKKRISGIWIGYEKNNTYQTPAHAEKETFIRDFMGKYKPATVLDLGCNTGEYSICCAQLGARVISVDSDHDCVEILYQRAKRAQLPVLPLVMDLANPSPGLGFMNSERGSFLSRAPSDAVIALALVHHLLISARLPVTAICRLMESLARRYLVIEFVERQDEMFQTLLALRREEDYEEVTLDKFIAVFRQSFTIIKQMPLQGTKRHLLLMERSTSQ